ncbi:MAG: AMP-binding protein, partial [Desulfopila sp.]|nr:AMP-binding protein [Desulfopila sp.]
MGRYDLSFYDVIKRNGVACADGLCWHEVDDDRTLTFSQYQEEIEVLAAGLAREGVKKGDRIGVLGKNSLEYFLIYGAAAFLGAIVLPINWRLSVDEVCFNLNDCEPLLLFVDAEFQQNLQGRSEQLPSVISRFNLKEDQGTF